MKISNKKNTARIMLIIFLHFLAFVIGLIAIIYYKLYYGTDPEQLLFHAKANLTGADTSIAKTFFLYAFIPGILLTGLSIPYTVFVVKKNFLQKWKRVVLYRIFPVFLSFVSLSTLVFLLDIPALIKYQTTTSAFIEENYVNPDNVSVTFPEQKRNFIYIQVESLEQTMFSEEHGGVFPQDIVPEIYELFSENITFSGNEGIGKMYSLANTTWTAASMVATSSGLPLKGYPIDLSNGTYMSDVKTIYDIFTENGYDNYYICGSDSEFASNKLYMTVHGNQKIFDYNTAKEQKLIPENYHEFWGFEDKKLYEFSKNIISEVANSDKPFTARIVTVDTHFPEGYYCEDCQPLYGAKFLNAYACASKKVKEFLDWAKEQPFYDNTTFLIAGDHNFMSLYMEQFISDDYVRTPTCIFVNSAIQYNSINTRKFSSFDLFPTVLASLGCEIKGNRLGLGVNLFSDEKAIVEKYGYEYVNKELRCRSEFYNKITGQE